ncbi:hypothetical protein BATDEDRAFT_22666 [Batrachochytrium dendrobatidis JAM81]|uniref:Uncharacterized protein n=2 Tax=Batrachochytrium dendrobatidis TaxID=109871 RepID=F4NX76_BATDJ|nr:uncharacterized protein BATDEDRAFT_22666 [Batrachochytrium dendrobatidis JAM81]EGF82315.1 hypothetical protein BATDEDRAFT_22666 [Batrachochytrium dendrobatidis JAM81]|eukprot:XP_006676599.1 hypothetical protein BATDEDRAFT_22666 [Batrachochytrium dendrobatidis JAM81]
MPLTEKNTSLQVFVVYLMVHSRCALTTYMVIKGIKWAYRSNLSFVFLISLIFGSIQAFLQATFFNQMSLNCSVHIRLIYATWIICTLLLNSVLYYRAWCISSTKPKSQIIISVLMTIGHLACLCNDADYSFTSVFEHPKYGCMITPGWPRTLYGSFATLNDTVHAYYFCAPLFKATKNSAVVSRSTAGYIRMITKSIICLAICTVSNIAFAILITIGQEVKSMIFLDIAFLCQILCACEIQFNTHRETDRALLGSFMMKNSPLDRLKRTPHDIPSIEDDTTRCHESIGGIPRILICKDRLDRIDSTIRV